MPLHIYQSLTIDIKEDYWEDRSQCPIRECDFKTAAGNSNETLRKHMTNRHNIDVRWVSCDHCNFRAKTSQALIIQIAHKKQD